MFESLKIESLNFQYSDGAPVLRNIFMEARKSEIVGLVGRNGSGKSTFFNALTVFSDCTASVFINNVYIPKKELINQIAYLPQNPFLPKEKSVRYVIKMFQLTEEKRNEIITDERISRLLKQKVKSLSGGERRYLEFLMINAHSGNIKILDEPFSEIEPIFEQKICEQILKNKNQNLYIITDHKLPLIKEISTRLVLLKDGTFIEISDAKDLLKYGYASN